MQICKKIDLKENSTFFSQSCSAMFLAQTVHHYQTILVLRKRLDDFESIPGTSSIDVPRADHLLLVREVRERADRLRGCGRVGGAAHPGAHGRSVGQTGKAVTG